MLWSSITGSNRLPWILGNRYSQLYDHFLWFVVIHSALSYGVWFQSIIWRLFLIAELAWDINRPIFCKQVRSTFRGEGAATHRLFVAQLLQKSAFCLWIILVFLIMTYVVFSRKSSIRWGGRWKWWRNLDNVIAWFLIFLGAVPDLGSFYTQTRENTKIVDRL